MTWEVLLEISAAISVPDILPPKTSTLFPVNYSGFRYYELWITCPLKDDSGVGILRFGTA